MMKSLWEDIHAPFKRRLTETTTNDELEVLDEGLCLCLTETIFLTSPTPDEILSMVFEELCEGYNEGPFYLY